MGEFLSEINWSPLWISLKTGVVATVIAFFLGVFCARKIMKLKPGARAVLDGILTMPLVLPPTVAGFCLLLLFSLKRPFGSFLLENFDIKVVQTWTGCVIAASVIAFGLRDAFDPKMPTTLEPTKNTVSRVAREMNSHVELVDGLVDAFGADQDKFKALLCGKAAEIADQVDVILLAQGSMAYAEDAIHEKTGKPVLSSPRFGAQALAAALKAKGL